MDDLRLYALAVILPVTFYTELSAGKIYNWMTLPAIGLGLFLAALLGLQQLVDAVWGAVIGGGIFMMPYLIAGVSRGRPVVGGGDVKLAAAIGALTNAQFVLQVIWWGCLAGGMIGLGLVAWQLAGVRRATDDEAKPSVTAILGRRIPFGTALSIGVAIAFWQTHLL